MTDNGVTGASQIRHPPSGIAKKPTLRQSCRRPTPMFQDLHDYLYHLAPDGGIPLKGTGIALGLLLIASHLFALMKGDAVRAFLKDLPRNYKIGAALLTIDFLWSMMIMSHIDMGEFFHLRRWFLMLIPVGFVLVLTYVKEFLAVRALGALMLLVSGPVLAAAFLQPQISRLLLPILAYAWILAGMFWVGMPFLMRDWIGWLTARDSRWKLAVYSGITYGALLLIVAVVDY